VDVPGLIEGASRGAGLGDRFLRHIERTRVLIHLIDGAQPAADAMQQLEMIREELRAWNPKLLSLRRIVTVSKLDLPDARETLAALKSALPEAVHGISAVTGAGVKELMAAVYAAVVEARRNVSIAQAKLRRIAPVEMAHAAKNPAIADTISTRARARISLRLSPAPTLCAASSPRPTPPRSPSRRRPPCPEEPHR